MVGRVECLPGPLPLPLALPLERVVALVALGRRLRPLPCPLPNPLCMPHPRLHSVGLGVLLQRA